MVKLAELPRSSFYYSDSHQKTDHYAEERKLLLKIQAENKGRYGYRRMTLEFRNQGKKTNHKVIQKLMHEENIVCREGTVGKITPNLLQRNFKANKPNEKWVTDVTQFSLFGTKLYLSPILDLYDESSISWNIKD